MLACGTVIWFSKHKGFGFIRITSRISPDAYVHYSDIVKPTQLDLLKNNKDIFCARLKKGQIVSLKLEMSRLGPVAKEVVPL